MGNSNSWRGLQTYTSAGFVFEIRTGSHLGRHKCQMLVRLNEEWPFSYVDLGMHANIWEAEAHARNLARQYITKGPPKIERVRWHDEEE